MLPYCLPRNNGGETERETAESLRSYCSERLDIIDLYFQDVISCSDHKKFHVSY